MDLELHQLDLRYEGLRRRDPRQERLLRASLEEHGQVNPVVVLPREGRFASALSRIPPGLLAKNRPPSFAVATALVVTFRRAPLSSPRP